MLREYGGHRQRRIGQYIDELDRCVEGSLPEQLQQQYAAACEGLPRSPDSAVPGRFVQSDQGRISDFEALMREAGSDDRVWLSVRDQILQDVSDRGLLERPGQLQTYLDQYGTVFNRFPDLRDELGNAASLRQQLVQTREAEQGLQRMLTTNNGSTVARYLSYGDENARTVMRGVLSSRDLATAISYETAGTFDPLKRGPTMQWGQHYGLIQFGEPQARRHGVDWNDPLVSQLGPNGVIASYFRSSGFKPGMSGFDLYSHQRGRAGALRCV